MSGGGSFAQAGLGLFCVIALILGLAWLARRAGFGGVARAGRPGALRIVDNAMLSARQRLVVVDVDGTRLVLGVSAGEIRTLHVLRTAAADAGGTTT